MSDLSILMPVYNERATIEEAIAQVLDADLPVDDRCGVAARTAQRRLAKRFGTSLLALSKSALQHFSLLVSRDADSSWPNE